MDSGEAASCPQVRRHFLRAAGMVAIGGMACAGQAWAGGSRSPGVDADLRSVLGTYGRMLRIEHGGVERVKVGRKVCSQPAMRLSVQVDDQVAFRRSFEAWTRLSDRVLVEGDTVRFSYNSRFYTIENRVV